MVLARKVCLEITGFFGWATISYILMPIMFNSTAVFDDVKRERKLTQSQKVIISFVFQATVISPCFLPLQVSTLKDFS